MRRQGLRIETEPQSANSLQQKLGHRYSIHLPISHSHSRAADIGAVNLINERLIACICHRKSDALTCHSDTLWLVFYSPDAA
jgi:hypothetical protein